MDLNNHDNRNARNLNKTHLNYKLFINYGKFLLLVYILKLFFACSLFQFIQPPFFEGTLINMFTTSCANR